MVPQWILTAALALSVLSSTANSTVTLNQVMNVIAASTGWHLDKRFSTEAEGLQHLYLQVLRAVHAHNALPYHSGDWWGSHRGDGSLVRVALDLFLSRTSQYLKADSRCLEWGVNYVDKGSFSTMCAQKWSFHYTSGDAHIDTTGRVVYANLDNFPHAVVHELNGFFDVIMCTQVFEHIDHPFKSALTIRKLLAPNGLLYFTVPFLQRYHIGHISEDPHFPQDQYRYTVQGVRNLWEHTGDMHILEQYASGYSLLTQAHLDGFGSQDFPPEELEDLLYDARNITMGVRHGRGDLYFQLNFLLKRSQSR